MDKSKCKCPNVKCKRHGDCKKCRANHKIMKAYCQRPKDGFANRMIDKMFAK